MYRLRKAALLLSVVAVVALTAGVCSADYQFDDLTKNRIANPQWIIINNGANTFGGETSSQAIRVSADVLTSGTAVIDVLSGNSSTTVSDRGMQTFFLVLSEGSATFDMSMLSKVFEFDAASPALGMNTIVVDNLTPYINSLELMDPDSTAPEWKNYRFNIIRQTDTNKYDTVVQSFIFRQLPGSTPSQAITRPMVISNVSPGTAQTQPLVVRMTLRDSTNADGNIIAYDRATWAMDQSKSVGNNQWVFVPVDDLNTDNARIEYYLTTEIANNTSYRYAARYYDSTEGTVPPTDWKFDIVRPQGTTNIPRSIILAPESNIAPGLVTVYSRRYNINEQNKTPLHLFPVNALYGDYGLTLNHKILFGQSLGETYKYAASEGRFNLFEVTPFKPKLASTTFYEAVAAVTKSAGTVTAPSTAIFSASSIKRDVIADDVLEYFTVNQSIPSGIRGSDSEGILPLHITFNIPVTRINDNAWWNEMLKVWRNTGRIEDMFANKYDLYLRAGENNVWNLTQELKQKGYYNELVKVFLDDTRGRMTQDNYSGLLTVSFIVMLMDGTRDGVRPELSIVPDNSVSQQNNYIVIRDGELDNRWNMTFFVAPSGWQDNPTTPNTDNNNNNNSNETGNRGVSGGSGGGGCDYGFGIFAALMASALFIRRRDLH